MRPTEDWSRVPSQQWWCGRVSVRDYHRWAHTDCGIPLPVALRRAGVPMAEINQLLRHRYLVTTARYAHEDLDALAEVACPWPGGTA